MCRLWTHEVLRVFGDRLVDDNDRKWLVELIQNTIKSELKLTSDVVFERLKSNQRQLSHQDFGSLMFGDFANLDSNDRAYDELEDLGSLTAVSLFIRW